MKMSFRWYGEGNDDIPLSHIKQIPGVEEIVWGMHHKPVGEIWEINEIENALAPIRAAGFNFNVVESVNVHESIKLGHSERDLYIENYAKTLENLSKFGIKVVCYNFMPVFDWTRTDLYKALPDGSNALFFDKSKIEKIDPKELIRNLSEGVKVTMPGWEPERLKDLELLFKQYENFTSEKLWENLGYFLKAIIPIAEKYGIKMAIHPDDPAFPIFGLPRIITNKNNIKRLLDIIDSSSNGLTICTGSLGSIDNDIADIVDTFHDKIYFMHIRNVKRFSNGDFIESSHRDCDGSVDILKIIKNLNVHNYEGYIRPDHGRHIWGEDKRARPGYGLYDRALGVMYILGAWDYLKLNSSIDIK